VAAAQPAASLEDNIAAYDDMRKELEESHFGKWVVFHDRRLFGFYASFSDAANAAMEAFGDDPYLIRQVRNYPEHLPVSALIGGGKVAHS
jgi:hypothetical protein